VDQGAALVPRILCAIPAATFERVMRPETVAALETLGEVTYCQAPRDLSEEEYAALWEQADAIMTGWGFRSPLPETVSNLSRLRIVSHTAGTVRMLPRALLERGTVVTSARAAIARTVAEFCLLNAITLLRRYAFFVDTDPGRKQALLAGGNKPPSETLYGKTVGLIGFGYVARLLRELLRPFECRVLVHDPYLSESEAAEAGIELVELVTLLRQSKVVSLHAPDIPATHGMIGSAELKLMRDGAVFINSARGKLVDTEALTAELKSGRFFAAIDVTDPEPLSADHPLRTLPNVIFTPHIAGPTDDDLYRLGDMAVEDLSRFLRGEKPLYPVSLEAYDLMSF
jgi:phosphoglycerate dehydrogenase-like enzyme